MLPIIEKNEEIILWKILEKVFITNTFTQCKTSRTFKIDVFKIADNQNFAKLFSKHELLFLDQANSSSDPSQIFILEFFIPTAFLLPSPSLPNFTLVNWNLSLTQSSSSSSLVFLFCPTPYNHTSPKVLNIPNHIPIQVNQI